MVWVIALVEAEMRKLKLKNRRPIPTNLQLLTPQIDPFSIQHIGLSWFLPASPINQLDSPRQRSCSQELARTQAKDMDLANVTWQKSGKRRIGVTRCEDSRRSADVKRVQQAVFSGRMDGIGILEFIRNPCLVSWWKCCIEANALQS